MRAQRVDTTCSYEHWKLKTEKGWKDSEIYKAGIGALMKTEVLPERLLEVEKHLVKTKKYVPLTDEELIAKRRKELWGID